MKYHSYQRLFCLHERPARLAMAILFNVLSIVTVRYHDQVYACGNETVREYADRMGEEMARKIKGVYTYYDYKDILWFYGHDEYREQLSERYQAEQLWRGSYEEWKERCLKVGLNPHYNYD